MRITNAILTKESLRGLRAQMRDLAEARERAATGVRVARASDDPVAAASIMRSSDTLRALQQYRSNVAAGQSRLAVEDSVLEQLGNALTRARELAVSQGGDTADEASRRTVRAEVEGLVELTVGLANTRLGEAYVFGGAYSDTPPLPNGVPDPARPATGSPALEIGNGSFVEGNHGAQEIFVDSGVMDALTDLSAALDANDPEAIQAAEADLAAAFQRIQEIVGELGARMSQLDVTESNLASLELNFEKLRSDLADADVAEAVTELVQRQTSLEASMLVNARILDITLADYLR